MKYSVAIQHIDTCFPEYLTDHHNRDGELLVGVPVDATTTNGEVAQGILDEINGADYGLPDWLTDDMIQKAVDDELPASVSDDAFDDTLDCLGSSDDEPCDELPTAWFLLTFSEDDDC